jgi:hypothetical protein
VFCVFRFFGFGVLIEHRLKTRPTSQAVYAKRPMIKGFLNHYPYAPEISLTAFFFLAAQLQKRPDRIVGVQPLLFLFTIRSFFVNDLMIEGLGNHCSVLT